jgi:hypothetical protein
MKKFLSISIMFLVVCFVGAVHNAHAVGFVELFPVNSPVSTTPQYEFDQGETPYIYMKLAIPDSAIAATISGWNDPDGLGYFSDVEVNANTERWAFLSDWSSVEKAGPWTIHANYFDSFNNNIVASTNFTVTPEPATMGLLLMGGIPLFLNRKQRISKS